MIRNVSFRNSDEESSRPGGRPRDAAREAHILSVVYTLLTEVGYDALTFEEVARRAGASKATLYRRWKNKRDMVSAALRAMPARRDDADEIDTGSLRGDLLALCRRLLTTMQSTDGQTALLLLQAGIEDPGLCDQIERTVGPTGARLPASVIDAAVRRGELPCEVDPFAYEEVVGAVVLLRRMNGLDCDDSYLETLVDHVVVPALCASPAASGGLPAGIFSGHPDRVKQ